MEVPSSGKTLRAAMKSLALVWEFINARLFDPVYCRSISANTDVTCVCKVRITQNSAHFFCYDGKWSFKVSDARPSSSPTSQMGREGREQRVAWLTPSGPQSKIRAITLPKKVTWDAFRVFAYNVEQVQKYLRETDANAEIILEANQVIFTDRNNGFALQIESTSRDPLELAEMHSSGEGMSKFRPYSRTWIPEADLRPLKIYFRAIDQAKSRVTELLASSSNLQDTYNVIIREICESPQSYEKAYEVAAIASLAMRPIQSLEQPPLDPVIPPKTVEQWCKRMEGM